MVEKKLIANLYEENNSRFAWDLGNIIECSFITNFDYLLKKN